MSDKKSSLIGAIVNDYGAQLSGFIRGRVNKVEDAEDILQDVWFQLSRISDLYALENVGAWLFKVARNRIIDQYRKNAEEYIEDQTYSSDTEDFGIKEILLPDESNDPEISFLQDLFWEELYLALEELPAEQKEVFLLSEIEGLLLKDIAGIQQIPLKTVISRKGYAVKHLRARLQQLYNDLIKTS